VALVGKGSFDYRDHLGLGGNLIPPMLVASAGGLVAADLQLGDVVGKDGVPEIAIGRIPVLDAAELEAYLAKIIAYEAEGAAGWRQRVLMVADDADVAGDFAVDSDQLAGFLPADAAVGRVYLLQPYTPDQARARILGAVDEGVALLNYVGHGGLDRMAAEGMVVTGDVAAMNNGERLPVVTSFTCYLAMFSYPGYSSLGEELVLRADGGAAAVWGPTGLSSNQRAVALGEKAMAVLLDGDGRVGDAVIEAIGAFVEAGGDGAYPNVYAFLGDPGLEGP
jgi:hypothetical protein